MTSTVSTKLAEARKLIERGWTRHANARGKNRRPVMAGGSAAVCWCAYGALKAVQAPVGAMDDLRKAIGSVTITGWNDADGRTQAEVIEAFKRAEQLARDSAE